MPGIFILFAVIVVAAIAWSAYAAKKRREAMALLAAKLGLRYSSGKDRNTPSRFQFLDALQQGSNHYAFNIISGAYKNREITVFDFHYETHSTDSKGRRQTHHHYFSFFILILEKSFPELKIGKEGIFSKIAQAVGFDDIDFESHEFSRKFCVRSKNKKFAYDICNALMIDYLLENTDLTIEIESNALAIGFGSRLNAEQIESNLGRLLKIRELMPNYLFTE